MISLVIYVSGDPIKGVGLDKFLARNTSEDNVSFVEIMNEAEKKHRLKHAWLFDKEQQQLNVCVVTVLNRNVCLFDPCLNYYFKVSLIDYFNVIFIAE